jgi:hypothetical protein
VSCHPPARSPWAQRGGVPVIVYSVAPVVIAECTGMAVAARACIESLPRAGVALFVDTTVALAYRLLLAPTSASCRTGSRPSGWKDLGHSAPTRAAHHRWTGCCEQTSVEIDIHQLRHAHATELINNGISTEAGVVLSDR